MPVSAKWFPKGTPVSRPCPLNDFGPSKGALKTGPVAEYIGKLDAGGRRSLVLLSCSLLLSRDGG